MGETQIGVLVEIVAAALQRNYPDATAEMVENLLDLGNASAVLNAVLTGSGLKLRGRLGEAAAPGTEPGGRLDDRGNTRRPGAGDADGWGHIYGLLATACGYSYPVIDEMTLFDFEELTAYWVEHPPVHILVGAYLGVGKHQRKRDTIAAGSNAGLGYPSAARRTRPGVWRGRRACRTAGRSARFCRAATPSKKRRLKFAGGRQEKLSRFGMLTP